MNGETPLKVQSLDTCWAVPVFDADGNVWAELLLYGITKTDIYTTPNEYVSEALRHHNIPLGYSVSPFAVYQIR